MKRLACEFVEASEVFDECRQAWEAFSESEPDCSWGDNNRTLVTPNVIIDALEGADVDDDVRGEVDKVLERLNALPPDLYIDLEN